MGEFILFVGNERKDDDDVDTTNWNQCVNRLDNEEAYVNIGCCGGRMEKVICTVCKKFGTSQLNPRICCKCPAPDFPIEVKN